MRPLEKDTKYRLALLLRQTLDAVVKARQKELTRYGITSRQSAILTTISLIEKNGGVPTPAEISRWQFREPNTISVLLNGMVKHGLIEKTKDLPQKNLIRITITDKGKRINDLCQKRESVSKILTSISKEERKQMESVLKKVRDAALSQIDANIRIPFP